MSNIVKSKICVDCNQTVNLIEQVSYVGKFNTKITRLVKEDHNCIKQKAPNQQELRTDNAYYNKLNEQVKELDTLWQYDRNEKMLSDEELNGLCIKYGVKKTYHYGASYYGEARVFLLSGNNGAIFWNDNGASYYYKDASIAFSKAKGYVNRRYGLTRLMGF